MFNSKFLVAALWLIPAAALGTTQLGTGSKTSKDSQYSSRWDSLGYLLEDTNRNPDFWNKSYELWKKIMNKKISNSFDLLTHDTFKDIELGYSDWNDKAMNKVCDKVYKSENWFGEQVGSILIPKNNSWYEFRDIVAFCSPLFNEGESLDTFWKQQVNIATSTPEEQGNYFLPDVKTDHVFWDLQNKYVRSPDFNNKGIRDESFVNRLQNGAHIRDICKEAYEKLKKETSYSGNVRSVFKYCGMDLSNIPFRGGSYYHWTIKDGKPVKLPRPKAIY